MHPNSRLECPKYARLIPKKGTKSLAWKHYSLPVNDNGDLVSENLAICNECNHPVSAKGGSTSNLISHLKNYHPSDYVNFKNANQLTPTTSSAEITQNSAASTSEVDSTLGNDMLLCKQLKIEIEQDDDASMSEVDSALINDMLPCKKLKTEIMQHFDASTSEVDSALVNDMPPCKKQKTLLDFQPLTSYSEKQCTAAVAKFIATEMQPFSIVESPPFIKMVNTLNPWYILPGRKYFSKTAIPKLFNDTIEKIKRELALVKCSNVSITTDCWTSVNAIPFIAITVHFIDNNWKLKSACLSCVHFDMDHTVENISEVLTEKLSTWNLNMSELCSCTTDNGANILKAVGNFDVQHVPCFGHTINIGINRALQIPILHKAIAKVKNLQSTISHSWKISRDLSKVQELLQMKILKLPSACPTCWLSTLKLCKRFLENQLPLCKVLQDYKSKKHLMLEANEVSSLEDFVHTTRLMEDISKNLSGEEYTTASSVLPLLTKLKKNLQCKDTDNSLTKEIKEQIFSALEEHYFGNNELICILRISTVCDPRFRLFYIDNKEEVKKLVLSHMVNIYENDINMFTSSGVFEKTEKYGLEKLLDSDHEEEVIDNTSFVVRKAENELDNYLSMPKIGLNDDPLTWWKSHEVSFPSLQILSKKFLAIQGTSVPSERVFSSSDNMINKNKWSLLPKNAEMQVFLTQNKNFI